LKRPAYITFDCYGTLVDFDLGPITIEQLGPRLARLDREAFLNAFEELRFQEVLGPYRPYREVLKRSLERAERQFGIEYEEADGEAIVAAVPAFGPFPEVPPVLERLRPHFRLVIVSNSDDDLIAENVRRIGVPFERVITSAQAGVYKPSPAMFQHVLETLGCEPGDILHVAQGFRYDIIPTHNLGWRQVWINRRGQPGDGIHTPYRELPDLSGLPAILGIEPVERRSPVRKMS
jgi:2-haloacid dehalogenase